MRFYLHGIFFLLFTDHKPLLGLLTKNEDAPNNRIMTMILATAEYSFKIDYIPGIRNILADFGTRFIDESEWDKPQEDDNEGLHQLFSFQVELPVHIMKFLYDTQLTEEDKQELQKARVVYEQRGKIIMVIIRNQQLFYVPCSVRRPLFWHLHKDLHDGSLKMLQNFRELHLFWPYMSKSMDEYLSQCICATKKNKAPHKYSELKHIIASHPLHILAIDLYFYANRLYFTAFDVFSRFCWVKEILNKHASVVLEAYLEFCDTYAQPSLLSCDNGGEFVLIEQQKIPHPSEHPEANGIIERFHEELGKLCRIHSSLPDEIFGLLNTTKSTLLMHSYIKSLLHDSTNCVLSYETRQFSYNNLVWRKIPSRKRAKCEDTFSGPHRVLGKVGKFSYQVTSHVLTAKTLLVNLNDIKILHIPDCKNWKLNSALIPGLLSELNSKETLCEPMIDYNSIGALVNDLMESKQISVKFFIVPDWPCSDWYKPLHEHIMAEAIQLPDKEDTFIVQTSTHTYPVGKFAWSHWLFELR